MIAFTGKGPSLGNRDVCWCGCGGTQDNDDADDDRMVAKLLKTLNLLFKEGRGCSWGESAYDIGPELLIAHQVRRE